MRRTRWSKEGPFQREGAQISRNRGSQRLLAGTDVLFRSFPWWEEGFDTERICSALAEDLLCPCCSQPWLLLGAVIFWQVPRSPVPLGELEGSGKRSRQLRGCGASLCHLPMPPKRAAAALRTHLRAGTCTGLRLSFARWLQVR